MNHGNASWGDNGWEGGSVSIEFAFAAMAQLTKRRHNLQRRIAVAFCLELRGKI
jgi:hypothetical protein